MSPLATTDYKDFKSSIVSVEADAESSSSRTTPKLIRVKAEKHESSVTMAQLQNFVLYMAEYQSLPSPQPASTMPEADRSARILLVVDGYFSLGRQNHDDRSFSIVWLIIPVAEDMYTPGYSSTQHTGMGIIRQLFERNLISLLLVLFPVSPITTKYEYSVILGPPPNENNISNLEE
jgi:hypothetical protein